MIVRLLRKQAAVGFERAIEILEVRLLHVTEVPKELHALSGVAFAIEPRLENARHFVPLHAPQIERFQQLGSRTSVFRLFDERLQHANRRLMLGVLAQRLPKLVECTPGLFQLSEAKLAELVSDRCRVPDALVDLPLVECC